MRKIEFDELLNLLPHNFDNEIGALLKITDTEKM